MKKSHTPLQAVSYFIYACLTMLSSYSQGFNSGSSGAYGPLNVTSNVVLDLPADGILHCTTINIASTGNLSFRKNPLNTPVYLLSQGDVRIDGTISVNGGKSLGPFIGGIAGPGGFDGGGGGSSSASQGILTGGAGRGPGAGKPAAASEAGAGSYGLRPISAVTTNDGDIYGSPLLVPLVGGSGGAGVNGESTQGGGGGGGAILIASSTLIRISSSGYISARGGQGTSYNGGSGGAVRLLAPKVFGNGTVDVRAGGYSGDPNNASLAGAGRIRVDSIFLLDPNNPTDNLGTMNFNPADSASIGANMISFPPNAPRLDIINAAGNAIAEGIGAPVQFTLPFGSSTNQTVVVQARNFGSVVPIRVVLTPQNGQPLVFNSQIDNTTVNPATASVSVTVPINMLIHVHAWTR